jgi:hypothetical protein
MEQPLCFGIASVDLYLDARTHSETVGSPGTLRTDATR